MTAPWRDETDDDRDDAQYGELAQDLVAGVLLFLLLAGLIIALCSL